MDKLSKAIDPDDPYSYEEFMNEYSNMNGIEYQTDGIYDSKLGGIDFKIEVNYVNKSNNPNPEYATPGSAGFDLRANAELTIQPGEFKMVPTGLYFNIPDNMEIQVRSRSGLAAKHGVTVLNTPGTVDSDYRGEIIVILINHSKEPFKIEVGDRIAQAVVAQTLTNFIKLNNVSEISNDTERSSGGFGSTGIK